MVTVKGKTIPWRPGLTVAQLLRELNEEKYCELIKLNGKVVRQPDWETTEVPDGSEVVLVPLVIGG